MMLRRQRRPLPALPPTGLSLAAQTEYERCIRDYADALLSEAQDLEIRDRVPGAPAEVTARMVNDADLNVRRNRHRRRASPVVVIMQLVTAAALIAVGVATNNLDKTWGQILFAVSVAIAMIAQLIALSREQK